jgi:hypothetical protein
VDKWIEGARAPVPASTADPAWMANVSMCMKEISFFYPFSWQNRCPAHQLSYLVLPAVRTEFCVSMIEFAPEA